MRVPTLRKDFVEFTRRRAVSVNRRSMHSTPIRFSSCLQYGATFGSNALVVVLVSAFAARPTQRFYRPDRFAGQSVRGGRHHARGPRRTRVVARGPRFSLRLVRSTATALEAVRRDRRHGFGDREVHRRPARWREGGYCAARSVSTSRSSPFTTIATRASWTGSPPLGRPRRASDLRVGFVRRDGGGGTPLRRAPFAAAIRSPRCRTCSYCMPGMRERRCPGCTARPGNRQNAIPLQRTVGCSAVRTTAPGCP